MVSSRTTRLPRAHRMVLHGHHIPPHAHHMITACYLVVTAWFFIWSPHDFSYGTPYFKTTQWTTRLHRAHHTHHMVIVWFHRGPLDYPELTVWLLHDCPMIWLIVTPWSTLRLPEDITYHIETFDFCYIVLWLDNKGIVYVSIILFWVSVCSVK